MRRPRLRRAPGILAFIGAVCPALASAGEAPSWVFFRDRGRDASATARAVEARAAELSPRALARRQRVRGDGGVDPRDLAPEPGQVAAVLATGATLRTSSRWLNAISVEATPAQRAAIAALAIVDRVQPVTRRRDDRPPADATDAQWPLTLPATAADEAMYGYAWDQLSLLNVPFLHDCGLTGDGVVIGVQDSGFWLGHAALAGVDVVAMRDFVKNDDDVTDGPGDVGGQHDHGTMVLSLIAGDDPGTYMGAAPGVSVLLSKTEDIAVEEPFEEDLYVAGLEWIESMGADLFTASLGYVDWYDQADFDGQTGVTTVAADMAVAQGLIVFNAIGNSGPGPTTMGVPADAEGVISVGAIDFDGNVSDFSSRGPTADGRIKPNIVAPGRGVAVAHPGNPTEYIGGKGTSFAAPLAAGTAALLIQAFPDLDPAGMRAMLQNAGNNTANPNNDVGWGLPDAGAPAFLFCTCRDDDADGSYALDCGGDDCDDTNPAAHPGAAEVCDGVDNDCDTVVPPDEVDGDGDGALLCADDCDDADPGSAPGLPELCDDAVDNDCDELVDAADPACNGGESESGGGAGSSDDGGDDVPTGSYGSSSGSCEASGDAPVDAEGGCACATSPGSTGAPLLLTPLALAWRRRRHQPR